MRFYVWKKSQAVAILLGMMLLMVLSGVCIASMLNGQAELESEAVAAFAEADLSFIVETPAPVLDTALRVEIVRSTEPPLLAGKTVLIYHTHTWEAFEQVEGNRYEETEKWRSKDNRVNMVAVGNALAAALEVQGCTVVHDETAFEPPDLSTAYQRSLVMLEARQQAGETYDLYVDLHRDAIASSSTIKRTVNVAGEEVARFMVLVGKGQGYDEKPDWEANMLIAQQLTSSMNGQVEGLCRDIKVKTGRFNQHIAPQCVLIECGLNYNTLEEVLAGIPYLAQAIADTLTKENPGG